MKITAAFPTPPRSWSELSWQQLCGCWQVKMRYGGHADVARAAALLELLGLDTVLSSSVRDDDGETSFVLKDRCGGLWSVTPRELSQMAKQALPWFDFPYGDPGEPAVRDDKGKVVKEARDPVRGYVSPLRDALALPMETVKVRDTRFRIRRVFALPQVACSNLTWQQYRSLQALTPQMFAEGTDDDTVAGLQAQFLAHCLVPRSVALFDSSGSSIRLRPHYEFRYNAEQAEGMTGWWKRQLARQPVLFSICFQCYQTALGYYAEAYPMLFDGSGKSDPMRDALQGEVGTVNTIMKYANYADQQQVYDSFLPFVLDILNTMTKEAKEIEKMNAKIKKK